MAHLTNRKILLGVTGSISAYKAPMIVRELIKRGAEVRVVMTPSATRFVTALVLQNLTKHDVAIELFDDDIQSGGSWHIHLAQWCDVFLIAPCSATSLARIAQGLADTALSTLAFALPASTPLVIAPAMDSDMWAHPAVQSNIQILEKRGAIIIAPESGELASGVFGIGRLPEAETIANRVSEIEVLEKNNRQLPLNETSLDVSFNPALAARKVLITAGPTFERIDDVRFIGNFSSGKMGFALAQVFAEAGADVTLIAGPTSLPTPPNVYRVDVESASEMFSAVEKERDFYSIAVMSAAVADFTPAVKHQGKLKKQDIGETLTVTLVPTIDILKSLGEVKRDDQLLIGFALESENELENGRQKLVEKNCDMIVVNSAGKPRSGFGGDENTISIITRDGEVHHFQPMSKKECAEEIVKLISNSRPAYK